MKIRLRSKNFNIHIESIYEFIISFVSLFIRKFCVYFETRSSAYENSVINKSWWRILFLRKLSCVIVANNDNMKKKRWKKKVRWNTIIVKDDERGPWHTSSFSIVYVTKKEVGKMQTFVCQFVTKKNLKIPNFINITNHKNLIKCISKILDFLYITFSNI